MKNNNTGSAQYRQGDVFVERVAKLPPALKKLGREGGRVILAHGDATGHSHAVGEKDAALYAGKEPGVTYLQVAKKPASLTHDEHATIVLKPGVSVVIACINTGLEGTCAIEVHASKKGLRITVDGRTFAKGKTPDELHANFKEAQAKLSQS